MHMAALMMISLRYEYAEALPLGLGRLWAACGPAGDPNPPQEPQPENSSLQIMHVPVATIWTLHMDMNAHVPVATTIMVITLPA